MDPQPLHLRIHAVKVFVRDQDASLRFYAEKLGFEVAFDARMQTGERWVAVAPPHGTAVLTLIAPKSDSPEYLLIGQGTGVILVTENVAAKYTEWRKRGVRFLYAPRLRRVNFERSSTTDSDAAIWGGVFTCFRDPDGNTFELVGLDEVSRELEAQRRASAERIEAERRAAQELAIAQQVQSRLFPQVVPPIRTLDYAGICIQARQVGGDYYDFLDLGRSRFVLIVGDISGKGIAAALLMANLQASLRSQCAIALDQLQRMLHGVNEMFFASTEEGAYATLFFAEYDDTTHALRYVNCGHLSALLLRADGTVERLGSTATVVGLFKDWDCAVGELVLSPGDIFVLYTDGITEFFNGAGEDFGEHRLLEAIRRHRHLSAREAISAIVEDVNRFSGQEQQDDITLIVAKCRTAASA
jgi:serine phosphatase RsbU (regulator of sigma subunit)/catechol 2,3-dioxygenase-like lactoylglutathione lyase family enzyme